jgi:hypothetical protein
MKNLLMSAYNKKNDSTSAAKIQKLIEQESNLFLNSKNKTKQNTDSALELKK